MRQYSGDHLKGWFISPFRHRVFKLSLLTLILLFHLGCFFFCSLRLCANFLPHYEEFEMVPGRSIEESSRIPYFGRAVGKQALFIAEGVWVSMTFMKDNFTIFIQITNAYSLWPSNSTFVNIFYRYTYAKWCRLKFIHYATFLHNSKWLESTQSPIRSG